MHLKLLEDICIKISLYIKMIAKYLADMSSNKLLCLVTIAFLFSK